MGALMRSHDWTKTALGLPETWPQPLKTLVSVMLGSKQPMFVVWGPERTLLYNDAYAEILVSKHPGALGCDFLEAWSEIRADLAPIVDQAYAGEPVHMDDIALVMERRGHPEETHFAFSYTPVRGADGAVAGFFCPCVETTGQVLAERRRGFRLALDDTLRGVADPSEIVALASEALGRHLGVGQIVYAEVDAGGEFVTIDREWNDGTIASNAGRHRLDDYGPAFISDLRRGETTAVADVRLDPRTSSAQALAAFARASLGGVLNVPLLKAERLVAMLGVHSATPRAWSVEDVALAQEVAERTWDSVERARAEASQRETSRRLNAVLDNASVSIFLMGGDHRCLYMNPAAEALTGYTLAETQGCHLHDVIHHTRPDGSPYPSHECPIDGVSPDTDRQQGEEMFVHKSGRFVPVAFAASSIRDEAGEPVGTIVEVQDIAERKAAETALRESEARLERALDAGQLGAWELDLATLAAWRSPQHDRIFGYETMLPEWTYGMFLDHVLDDDRDRVDAAFQAAIASAGRWDFECRIRRADGETRWIWAQGRVDPGAAGQPERVKGTVRDVTHRRVVEERLRELNEGLEQRVTERTAERNRVWEMSRDLFAIMGFDGHLKAINPAWETTLGRDTETLLSLSFREQVHPDDHQAVQAMMEQLLRGETVERFEDRIRHADGSWRWISWTLVPEGDVFYAVGRDVTPEKEAAAELEHAQEALRQSQKMEAMGQLTGGVAHDFNNLLTPIVGSLDMLQRKGLGSEREQRLIAGAMQSADRAKTLVQRLLAFARRQPLQASAVDVDGLVTGMADLVASTSGPQIKVVVEAAEDMPPAKADPNQLEMALLNLGVNARDAMPDGGTLRITAGSERVGAGHRSKLRPGEYIRLSVADTGLGMDEATLKRAVEPFFSTKGVGKGTGLGLSMVHGLASQLGGALTIESRPGVGTNVELWLPVSEAPAQQPKPATVAAPAPAAKGTVLLVDDEELVRMSTADMLGDIGYAVVEAGSAEEALRLLEGGLRPDLLVTDHLMPGMNGTDLAHVVRSDRPGIRVLIVSGYAEGDGIDSDLPRLTKPFRNADLATKLSELARAD